MTRTIIPSHRCVKKFMRNGNMMPQLKPRKSEDVGIFDLQKYFNIESAEAFRLLLVYMVSCFIPDISHPILISTGSQGAAKTSSNTLIKKIVDPSIADVVSLPKDKRDLIVQLNRGYMHFFDNIRKIGWEFNDIFCQASTGGYQIARKLHTDDDIVAYKLQRCLILNGLYELTDQPDLLDRSIAIRYERIDDTQRLTDDYVRKNFKQDLPYFLGDIFNIVSKAMCIIDDVKLDKLPRMADFARWGYAIAEVMDIGGDNFIKYYADNRLGIGLELLQSDVTAMAILDYMKDMESWNGSVKGLWDALERHAIRKNINRSDPTWVKNANCLGRKLTEMQVNLAEQGVSFTRKNVGSHKELNIRYEQPTG